MPLDYYRILGLPIQVPGVETPGYAEQLKQAHRDRKEQLPRREYSEVATDARKQLIDEAYAVLCDPQERQKYDATFLTTTYDFESEQETQAPKPGEETPESYLDPHTPSLDIAPEQFIGALLILQELGEYELVLKLGLPTLSANNISLKNGKFGDPNLVVPDIVLTLALACLELGREQWQQGKYENAAVSLETGQELLLREGLFPAVRGEMQADLYKLRPYRILELLALPENKLKQRQHGLQLLQDMLEERGGIDGTGDDRSGLSVDDFLRFIQQLRSHLTAAEQQELFEAEARRPSAVATYLAVYALVARGFAERQPALIRRAKLLLTHLGRRQDVHLEQAVCALLLGQTEEAAQALELTQERETLAFIRANSEDSPDLLPGLCLYGERWMQAEVFPHFRDLASAQASLKDYFADEQVQGYLEALPDTNAEEENQWMVVPPPPTPLTVGLPEPTTPKQSPFTTLQAKNGSANGVSSSSRLSSTTGNVATLPTAIRTSPPPESARSNSVPDPAIAESHSEHPPANGARGDDRSRLPVASRVRAPEPSAPPAPRRSSARRGTGRIPGRFKGMKIDRLILLGVGGLLGLLLLWLLLSAIAGLFQRGPSLKGEQLDIALHEAIVPMPVSDSDALVDMGGPLNQALGRSIIQKWLSIKSLALGPEHQVEQLEEILMDPALSVWQQRAENARQENWYWEYDHNLVEAQVQASETDPNRGTVVVEVSEAARLFENGQQTRQREDNLQVQYQLVRTDGQWRIRDWEILR